MDMEFLPFDLIGHFLAPHIIKSRSEVEADRYKCSLCRKCQFACRRHAIHVNPERRIWTLYPRKCDLCLNCVSLCRNDALKVVR